MRRHSIIAGDIRPERVNVSRRLTRRSFLGFAGLGALVLSTAPSWADAAARALVAEAFDREVEAFLTARKIPGGALAVAKDGRLVYAKGYGWADRENRIRAQATTLFRIASISKPITAVAVLKLVEEGRLELDARAFDLLPLKPAVRRKPDPRLAHVTVRQLLQHTGGWDREKSLDPMFRSGQIARALDVPLPPGPRDIIRYMLGRKLDFDPGARHAYSNFGYCVLGRVIEQATGETYEQFVREKIFAPAGLGRMRLGRTLDGHQLEDESRYYTADEAKARSVFPNTARNVPWPYGGFCLEAMDAHGGWVASAVDLVRFAAALGGDEILKPATLQEMQSPPPPPVARKENGSLENWYYGLGWAVRPVGNDGRRNCWHAGSLPGTASLLVRRHDGLSWAVIFNQRSEDANLPDSAIDGALHRAANAVTDWPARAIDFP